MIRKLFILIVFCSLITGILYYTGNPAVMNMVNSIIFQSKEKGREIASNKSIALTRARALMDEAQALGVDLSKGQCLAEEAVIDWSVDIVHSPRQPEDDRSENQCQNFLKGRTRHLIEMDELGNIILIK